MSAISAVSPNVSAQMVAQLFALRAATQAQTQVLQILQSAFQGSGPASPALSHLGGHIDVRA